MVTVPSGTLPQKVPASNQMMFLYADGMSPVANTQANIVALGKHSVNGRPTDPSATLLNDNDVGSLMTSGLGEIDLDDPILKTGYEDVAKLLKLGHPSLDPWGGAPGQATPLFRGGVHPTPGLAYPSVPMIVELLDFGFRPSTISYQMASGTVVTSWQRPPLAHFDQDFYSPTAFLEALVKQYVFLGAHRFPLTLKLTRMGDVGSASVLWPVFEELQRQFAKGKAFPRGLTPLQEFAKRTAAELTAALPISSTADLRPVYLEALRQIARLAAANPHNLRSSRSALHGSLETLNSAMLAAFGAAAGGSPLVRVPTEDWAALGAAVFLVGTIPHGYRDGLLIFGPASVPRWEFTAVLRQP